MLVLTSMGSTHILLLADEPCYGGCYLAQGNFGKGPEKAPTAVGADKAGPPDVPKHGQTTATKFAVLLTPVGVFGVLAAVFCLDVAAVALGLYGLSCATHLVRQLRTSVRTRRSTVQETPIPSRDLRRQCGVRICVVVLVETIFVGSLRMSSEVWMVAATVAIAACAWWLLSEEDDFCAAKRTAFQPPLFSPAGSVQRVVHVSDRSFPNLRLFAIFFYRGKDGTDPTKFQIAVALLSVMLVLLLVLAPLADVHYSPKTTLASVVRPFIGQSHDQGPGTTKGQGPNLSNGGTHADGASGLSGRNESNGTTGSSATAAQLGAANCTEVELQAMLSALHTTSGDYVPAQIQTQLVKAWAHYHAQLIGCPTGSATQQGQVWVVPLQGGSSTPAYLLGNSAFGSVIFPDLASVELPVLASVESMEFRYRWGLGTAQKFSFTDGACGLAETYNGLEPIELPPSVLEKAIDSAPTGGFPWVTLSEVGVVSATYQIVYFLPDSSAQWGVSPSGKTVDVTYYKGSGKATGGSGPIATDTDSCPTELATLTSNASGLETAAKVAEAEQASGNS